MRTQSYILQLLLFVFITVWFVTPSHKPEMKKKKKDFGFLHWQRNIHCLILPQFPIVLKDCNSYFQGFLLRGGYQRLLLSFLFLPFHAVLFKQCEEPEVAYKFKSDLFSSHSQVIKNLFRLEQK